MKGLFFQTGNIPVSIESDAVSLKSDKAKRFFFEAIYVCIYKKSFHSHPGET